MLLSLLQDLYRLECCNSATEEDKAELRWLDCYLATEEEEDDFALLGGWLSETGGEMEMELVRWIATVFREIYEGAINAVMKGKLS